MRKILFIAILLSPLNFLHSSSFAQPGRPGSVPPPQRYTVSFESQHGEAFTVFIDGDLINRMPQSRVMVNDISNQTHQVVVVLKRPAEKAAVLSLRPGEPNVTVTVNYDMRLEQLYLFTPGHNRGDNNEMEDFRHRPDARRNAHEPQPGMHPTPPTPQATVQLPTEEDVDAMILRLKAMSFDSDRLALGKTIVAASPMKASQISRLAEAIDFSNSQVDFLKYAYAYCVDKENYYRTVEILTFSSDKKKVLDYIATQQ